MEGELFFEDTRHDGKLYPVKSVTERKDRSDVGRDKYDQGDGRSPSHITDRHRGTIIKLTTPVTQSEWWVW